MSQGRRGSSLQPPQDPSAGPTAAGPAARAAPSPAGTPWRSASFPREREAWEPCCPWALLSPCFGTRSPPEGAALLPCVPGAVLGGGGSAHHGHAGELHSRAARRHQRDVEEGRDGDGGARGFDHAAGRGRHLKHQAQGRIHHGRVLGRQRVSQGTAVSPHTQGPPRDLPTPGASSPHQHEDGPEEGGSQQNLQVLGHLQGAETSG